MPGRTAQLEQAYRNTAYRVDHADGGFVLRVGNRSDRLDALLAAHGVDCWAYITAWNPGSEKTSNENNRLRNTALRDALLRAGYVIYPGRSESDAGDWPAEESFLVPGMTVADAQELGAQFGQCAVLAGGAGGVVELVWCGG